MDEPVDRLLPVALWRAQRASIQYDEPLDVDAFLRVLGEHGFDIIPRVISSDLLIPPKEREAWQRGYLYRKHRESPHTRGYVE